MRLSHAAVFALALSLLSCAHRQPRSSAQIIMEGDRNPTIREDVQHAGEHVRETR